MKNADKQGQACANWITSDMIEAGYDAYLDLRFADDPAFGLSETKKVEGIAAIYSAMEAARSLRKAFKSKNY